MKLSKFRIRRIKQLQKTLFILENYPSHIRQSKIHEIRKDMIEWLISSEKKEATDVETYLNSFLDKAGFDFDIKKDYYADLIRLGMLYGYHHKRELWYL